MMDMTRLEEPSGCSHHILADLMTATVVSGNIISISVMTPFSCKSQKLTWKV